MDQMDVDPTTSLPSSSSKHPAGLPPTLSSAAKRAKIPLPDEQLTMLSHNMAERRRAWTLLVNHNFEWLNILSDVMMQLNQELAYTNMKDGNIANLTLDRASDIVKGFNEDELEEWKVGVQNVIDKNDWIDLLACCMCILDFQIV